MSKITIKIEDVVHRKLQILKATMGVKTLGAAIEKLIDDYMEVVSKGK